MKIRGRDFKLHKQTDDKGSAMVVVIIAMAFIGILASVLMYMSLLNYQMKANNLQAKDNFYSAETVLDEIRVHMEEQVSTSLGNAYTQILVNYDDTSVSEKESKLRYAFLSSMQKAYKCSDTASLNYYDLKKLFDSLSPEVQKNTVLQTSDGVNSYTIRMVDGTVQMTGTNGFGDAVSDLPKGQLTLFTDGLSFQKLKVTYTNDNGYVSVIQTDIRVKMPDMSFAQAVSLPSLTGMSLVAQKNIQVVAESGKLSDAKIAGSFYADKVLVGNEDDTNSANVTLTLAEPTGKENDDKRMVAATELYLGKGATLESDSYGELWAGKITMHGAATSTGSANMNFKGNDVYVAGDLRIDGANNNFTAGSLVDELGQLRSYLSNGGRVLLLTDSYYSTPNLDAVMAEFGLTRTEGLVVEGDTNHYLNGYPALYLLPDYASTEESTALDGVNTSRRVLLQMAQGITLTETEHVVSDALLVSSDSAYSKPEGYEMTTTEKADGDIAGPFTLAAYARNEDTGAQVIWVNCGNMDNEGIYQVIPGNVTFLQGCAASLAGQESAVLIDSKALEAAPLEVPGIAASTLGLLFVIVLPAALLAVGAVVVVLRRRK